MALLLVFFIINIDARSQQLLYNTGRTALIVHNVQGVVLIFHVFQCLWMYSASIIFSLALLIQHMTLSLFQGYSTFTLGQISLLSILITCTQLQHKHTQSDPPPPKKKKNNNNNKNKKNNTIHPKNENKNAPPQKNHLSKKRKRKKPNNKQKYVTISVYHDIFRHCCY